MKVTSFERKENKVKMRVEVGKEKFKEAVDRAYKRISQEINVPGFRKGKIPPKIIDGQVGKDTVLREALREALPEYYVKSLEEKSLKPIEKPEIEVVQLEEGKPLLFDIEVEVEPEVKLGKYKGVEVEREKAKVDEREIESQINLLRERFASLEVVSGRPVKEGDFVLVNVEGSVNGRPFEGGSISDYLIEVGSNLYVAGFDEHLIGARKGEIREFFVDMPENHPNKEIAGKKAKFRILVKEIKQKVLPEVNDEFAKTCSEFNTLSELKEDIRKRLLEIKEKEAEAKLRSDVLGKVSDASSVEIPEKMIKRRTQELMEELKENLRARGLIFEEYLRATGKRPEDIEIQIRADTRRGIKNRLVLEAVAKKEGIKVLEKELEEEIENLAKKFRRSADEIRKSLEESGNIEALKEDMLLQKSLNFLVENAKIKK